VRPPVPLRIGIFCLWIAAATLAPLRAWGVTFEADITYTTDYIFRGISQTGGRSAAQIDARASTADGTFLGVFASTLDRLWQHPWGRSGWDYEVQGYLGHRFDLSRSWGITLTGTSYSYLHGNTPLSDDYQEVSLAGSYLDVWTLEVGYIPNAVRFDDGYRVGRYPAYVADTSAQIPLIGRLAVTAGAGYYTSDEAAYAFGNLGLAFEVKRLRVDAGYYFAQDRAQDLFPYGRAGSRFAATVSWHF